MTAEAADGDALMGADLWADPVASGRPSATGAGVRRSAPDRTAKRPVSKQRESAADQPVARICVDVGLAHLDRPFDYLVPASLDADAQPGVRVRVRFAGQLLDGIVLERTDASDHAGRLAFIEKVVSPVRVLPPPIARLAREIADRYAGSLADVVRLAVPPRHARAEAAIVRRTDTRTEPPAPRGRAVPPGSADVDERADEAKRVPPAMRGMAVPSGDAGADEQAAEAGSEPVATRSRAVPPVHVNERAAEARGEPVATRDIAASPGQQARADEDGVIEPNPKLPTLERMAAGWQAYPTGPGFLRALGGGRAARAVWTALPGEDWPARIAEAVIATLHGGRGALVVVADARDLDRVDAALNRQLDGLHVALSAAIGPEERYRRFLRALRGEVRVVIGNRAASFAPVRALGLVVIWDDGDDAHAEPRAPYPHAREVLLTRAQLEEAGVLLGGFGRTVEAAQLIDNGWAKEIVADRDAIRRAAPLVSAVGDDVHEPEAAAARMPGIAWRAARAALAADRPVLVQVPRRGYLPSVACATCRTPARCPHCRGPLSLRSASAQATCRWCARVAAGWACAACGGRSLRASIIGAGRTAEELGRVFTDVPVWMSGRDGVLATVPARAGLVIATPGAEPIVERGGYGAVLLLDTWALLTRADLRAGEETLRRWMAAAALAVPASAGGAVVVVADGGLSAVQALLRFDPGWLAARDLAERRELGFPPTVRMASLTGTPAAVADLLAVARLPEVAEILGPVPVSEDQERFLVRVPRSAGRALSDALRSASGVRSARKSPEPVRIQIDPLELL